MKSLPMGFTLVWLCLMMVVPPVHAHKVTLFAWVEGGTVYTQSKFSGGKMVKDGNVEVFDSRKNLLLTGRTDVNGLFSFKTPAITDLNIVLTAGMGHRNSWKLSANELGGSVSDAVMAEQVQPDTTLLKADRETKQPIAASGLTAQEMEAIIARQLEHKLQPLTQMVAASRNKGPTLNDILGGLGYILGLVGLGAYLRYRKGSRGS